MRPKRTFRSFLKNGKERKERNVLLQRTEKKVRMFPSFAKERENVLFFFQYIYWNRVDQLQILGSVKTGVLETSSLQKTRSQLYIVQHSSGALNA